MEESAKFYVDKWIKNENVKERDPQALFISPKIEEYEEFNDLVTNILAEKDEIEIIAADITKKKRYLQNPLSNLFLALECLSLIFENI